MEKSAKTTQTVESGKRAACICQAQPLMPVADAATLLHRSREYIYAGLREKRFPGAKFGRNRMISRAFVETFLSEVVRGAAIDFEEYAARWVAQTSEKRVAV